MINKNTEFSTDSDETDELQQSISGRQNCREWVEILK